MRLAAAVAVAAAVLSLTAAASPARADTPRERVMRALESIDELALDDATMGKLFRVLSTYERDRAAVLKERAVIVSSLESTDDPAIVDSLLDDQLANQRAQIDVDVRLGTALRAMLPPDQAARARMIVLAPPRRSGPPPGPACDPFAAMHGCR